MTYVRIRSWHTIALTYRSGAVKTRCGLGARIESTISTGVFASEPIRPTAETLPLDEKSCETCLRLAAHDEQPDVANDDATDVSNDEVTP